MERAAPYTERPVLYCEVGALSRFASRRLTTFGLAGCSAGAFSGELFNILDTFFQLGESLHLPRAAFVPRAAGFRFPKITLACRILKVLVNQTWSRSELANGKSVFSQALERRGERFHVGDLTGHQELQGIDRARIVTKVDKPLINNLGASFGGDVTAKVDIELTGDLQIVGGPRVGHGVAKADASTTRNGDHGVDFSFLAI